MGGDTQAAPRGPMGMGDGSGLWARRKVPYFIYTLQARRLCPELGPLAACSEGLQPCERRDSLYRTNSQSTKL